MQRISRNAIILSVVLGLIVNISFGQHGIEGRMTAADSIKFSIVSALPDSFPSISLVFKAHDVDNAPIWNLRKNAFKVYEDGDECEIMSLAQISTKRPIHIAVVIDHSGSMKEDYYQLYDPQGRSLYTYDATTGEVKLPAGYVSPIDNAKKTTREFVRQFDALRDSITVVGFASTVDMIMPLTNSRTRIDSVINLMVADSLTALYDAMLVGLGNLKSRKSINVMVVLTDGQNNSSKHQWNEVIKSARKLEVPIFIIGLGTVNKDTLQYIADSTRGEFIYTETSNSFGEIYARIRNEIQSFYDLRYKSSNFSSLKFKRNVSVLYESSGNDDAMNYEIELPVDVKAYLVSRERRIRYIYGASIGIILLAGTGFIIYKSRNRKPGGLTYN